MHCSAHRLAALAALNLAFDAALASPFNHLGRTKRHSLRAASQRARVRRQDFLHTTQPDNLADGSATADEGCTLWLQPWSGSSCLAIITYSPGLIMEDFLELNSAIDASCSNLETDVAYCIDTDDSHEASTVSAKTNVAVAKASSCKTKTKTKAKSSGSESSSSKSSSTGSSKTGSSNTDSGSKSSSTGSSKTGSSNTDSGSSKSKSAGRIIGGLGGLLELTDPTCGKSDATKDTSDEGGPNGKMTWLNCGISKSDPSSGWTWPDVKLSEVVYQNMSKTGIYAPCAPYFQYFEEAEAKHGIPAIFFAAFAMQESTCNPDAVGDQGGAWGLLQITTDKCGGAPNGKCADPEFNVMTGAAYFASVLTGQCGGNPLCAVGQYNGWNKGMSWASATAQASSCCVCQNNIDYQHQFFNAWIQNLNGGDYRPNNNLAICEDRTGNS